MTKKKILINTLSFVLKIMLVIVLIVLAFVIGAMVGYGVLGDGEPAGVFDPAIWENIFNYFKSPTILN
ncbi:DNA-directed RNA polymerase subunit beta [Desemzia sp. FAM 23991]|uniref:DNA-directed RNA polymerase subunit beta n=1 Tax=unclassified Desemzia TaxID=2685243 RepID=UPI00388BADC8